ncbi:MAG: DUF5615 family PIN-like protein [Cyclobacteriaceae bacterium]
MKFLANENFPFPSVTLLLSQQVEVISVADHQHGFSDEQVMKLSIQQERTILTHDSDYGELIFKHGYKPKAGVVYFRIYNFEPEDPAKILLELIRSKTIFTKRLTVVGENTIRQRTY